MTENKVKTDRTAVVTPTPEASLGAESEVSAAPVGMADSYGESLKPGGPWLSSPNKWKTALVRGLLFKIGQKLGPIKDPLLRAIKSVFDAGLIPPYESESLLEDIHSNPHLAAEVWARLPADMSADTQTLDFILSLSDWRLAQLDDKYEKWLDVKDEPCEAVKSHLGLIKDSLLDLESRAVRLGIPWPENALALAWKEAVLKAKTLGLEEPLRKLVVLAFSWELQDRHDLPVFLKRLKSNPESWEEIRGFGEGIFEPDAREAHHRYKIIVDSRDPMDWIPAEAQAYWSSLFEGDPHPDLQREAEERWRLFLNDEIRDRKLDWRSLLGKDLTFPYLMKHMPSYLQAEHQRRVSRNAGAQLRHLISDKGKLRGLKKRLEEALGEGGRGNKAFIQRLLLAHTVDAADVLGFLYWYTGLPRTDRGIEFQESVRDNMTVFLDYMQARNVRVSGNVFYSFLDRSGTCIEEVLASLFYISPGDTIHFLPPTLQFGEATPDLLILSQDGSVNLVEVKRMYWPSEGSFHDLGDRLRRVDSQLGGVFQDRTDIRRVSHWRIFLRQKELLDQFLDQMRQALQDGAYPNIDELNLVVSSRIPIPDQATYQALVIKAELKQREEVVLRERYGSRRGERLARLVSTQEGVDHRFSPYLQASLALKNVEKMKSATPRGVVQGLEKSRVRPIRDARPRLRDPNSPQASPFEFLTLGPVYMPTSLMHLASFMK